MSLQVWLPLIGTLENKGLKPLTINTVDTTITNDGKLGPAYNFSATTSVIRSAASECNITREHWSVGCWFYQTSSSASAHQWMVGIHRGSTASAFQFMLCSYRNALSLRCTGTTRNGPSISLNKWHHGMAVYDGTNLYFYLDGVLSLTTTLPTTQDATAATLIIGNRLGNAGAFQGKIQDVRIYDHALSAAEVKEIAQGLVLHYKLDSIGPGFGNPNLLKDTDKYSLSGNGAAGITRSIEDGVYKVVAATTNSNWCTFTSHNTTLALTQGDTFTFSMMIKSPDSVKKPTVYFQSGLGYYGTSGTMSSEWSIIYYTGTWSISNLTTNIHLGFQSAPGTYYIKYLKIEKGSIYTPWAPKAGERYSDINFINDSSGYNNNGTIIGAPTISNDTIRYSNCMNFPTNTDGILSTFPLALQNNAFTYSFWIKPLGENGDRSVYASSYSGTSCSIEKTAKNKLRFYWNGSPDLTTSSLTIIDGIWQHIAIVKSEDKTKVYCYYNGELKDTFTNTFSDKTFSGNLRIARDTREGATSYTGLMSDFRIYCTPLLDNDIKQLYNVSMKIDKNNNIQSFTFTEKQRNIMAAQPLSDAYTHRDAIQYPCLYYNSKGEIELTEKGSVGSNYIPINPDGHTYYYDITISISAGNQVHLGWERWDANKTSVSNQAAVYAISMKPSADIVKKRYRGTINLSVSGSNPCKYIVFRLLNAWTGTATDSQSTVIIHNLSLREVDAIDGPSIARDGSLIANEYKEDSRASMYKNGIVEAANIIER